MLPAFATIDDLGLRITVTDETRAQAALDAASALIRAEADPVTWVDDDESLVENIPDVVVTICLDVAEARYANPNGVRQETIGTYSYTMAGDVAGGGRQLSVIQRSQIRRAAKIAGISTITLESPYRQPTDTTYLEVDPPGEPIPWVGPEGY